MTASTTHKTRREFFFGQRNSNQSLHPLGALAAGDFHDACTRCSACEKACPEKIITPGDGGYPTLDFTKGGCTFCHSCIDACGTGALTSDANWPYHAEVADSCLSLKAVQCRICQDQCDQQAIRFRLVTGGRAQPLIDEADCTGCGACVAPCPIQAISIKKPSPNREVAA